ncbi:MAG: tRNA (adenosine(37)-N6)-dimethylallyltransferase MiaA [Clostridiales bacterium]|nr:tRNA (adenosine(37)-N6)-dimethylallyltransferase MiaA [Candidatus Crickella equi]
MSKGKVYVIAGPTASGKSAVAYYLAKRINGEIVNCDSIQLYKQMDIGSAKPSPEMMADVPHHLFSIVDPDFNMSVAKYQELAFACLDNILARGKTPIVVGGTGLYINSLLYKMDFAGNQDDGTRRAELEQMAEEMGSDYMYTYLQGIDPESAERIHPNNVRKVIRAIEAFELGDGIKSLDECEKNTDYDFVFCALNMEREWLYEIINNRVINLLNMGLIDEVKALKANGYTVDMPSMKGIGYKEVFAYLDGELDADTLVEEIQKDTRRYAKRQMTWFKRYNDINWIDVPKEVSVGELVDKIIAAGN